MIKTNKWKGGTVEEYETQHFGFGVQRLQISIRQMIEQKVTAGVREMGSYLTESLSLNDTDKQTLTHSCDRLIRLYCERAYPHLENIDREIKSILQIPENVLLPEDDAQSKQLTNEEFESLKSDVAALRTQIERGALMEALLISEDEEISSIEKLCEMARKDMDVIDLIDKNIDTDYLNTVISEAQLLCESTPFMKNSFGTINLFEK